MAMTTRWVDATDADAVALVRARSYRGNRAELETMSADAEDAMTAGRASRGAVVLAESGGQPVATATSYDCDLFVRGKSVPAHGVGYVGTDKTHRRSGEKPGAATRVMQALLQRARDEKHVASVLMPFRVSFYEHFGYGVAEYRHQWHVPTVILPRGDFAGIRYATDDDAAGRLACRTAEARAGQCDAFFGAVGDRYWHAKAESLGFNFVDEQDGDIRGYVCVKTHGYQAPNDVSLPVHHWRTPADLRRQLHWLATLVDQHGEVEMHLPVDLPLDMLLRERQVPHRPVIHATARCRRYSRMQLRVLDHVRWCDGQTTPSAEEGGLCIAVHECEGGVSKVRLDIAGGRISAGATDAPADVETSDVHWATLTSGATCASNLTRHGVLDATTEQARLLDVFAAGRAPWCNDYF